MPGFGVAGTPGCYQFDSNSRHCAVWACKLARQGRGELFSTA